MELESLPFYDVYVDIEKKCKGIMEIDGKVYKRKERLNEIFLVMQDVNHQLFTESVLDEDFD